MNTKKLIQFLEDVKQEWRLHFKDAIKFEESLENKEILKAANLILIDAIGSQIRNIKYVDELRGKNGK